MYLRFTETGDSLLADTLSISPRSVCFTACRKMFFAALISLSCVVLHLGQFHLRTDNGSVSIIKLQNEQVLELGKNLLISMTFPPFL